jgi:hypothetical protein
VCDARTSEHSYGRRENYACSFILRVPHRNSVHSIMQAFATGGRTWR